MELLFSFFEGLRRKAPGGEGSTRRALAMLDDLPEKPRIVDFGCGSGVAALVLAAESGGHVTAVDIHRPFLDDLDRRAAQAGLAEQITTVAADMGSVELPEGEFDLVWAEGAIYLLGVEQGLRCWRPLLRQGGYLAFTEVTWLTDDPPPGAAAFWEAEYPAITTVEENEARLKACGFELLDRFTLPPEDWANYFDPITEALPGFRSKHPGNAEAKELADGLQKEIDCWTAWGESYGYVFYVAKAVPA